METKEFTAGELSNYESKIKLAAVQKIITCNEFVHIGGSVALYLHGILLKRIFDSSTSVDLDICGGLYVPLKGLSGDKIVKCEDSTRGSDADYKEVLTFNSIKVDYRIDPAEPWEWIKHNGFEYRVTPLEIIMEAKFRYAMRGSKKHREDCYEICHKMVLPYSTEAAAKKISDSTDDLPF